MSARLAYEGWFGLVGGVSAVCVARRPAACDGRPCVTLARPIGCRQRVISVPRAPRSSSGVGPRASGLGASLPASYSRRTRHWTAAGPARGASGIRTGIGTAAGTPGAWGAAWRRRPGRGASGRPHRG